MSLQKVKKPNFLMKSDFIKHKSHTPQEKLYQNNLCPIYDFYRMDAELNANTSKNKENEKEQNNFRETSFTQYCNKFKTFSRMKSSILLFLANLFAKITAQIDFSAWHLFKSFSIKEFPTK